MEQSTGQSILKIIEDLYLYNRCLVSKGFDEALMYLKELVDFDIIEIPGNTECWTWVIPPAWTVKEAYVTREDEVILDVNDHPLHVACHSQPFEGIVDREELIRHLRWSEGCPDALVYEHIYAAHYRKKDWCLSLPYNRVKELKAGKYFVKIDTEFSEGTMKIGELLLPGKTDDTIIIMAHLCHPGQADDGLSGVALGTRLFQELASRDEREYTYLFLVVPETFGSVGYLWKRQELIPRLRYGIFLEMVGGLNSLALKYSYRGSTYIDKASHNVLRHSKISKFREGGFRELACNDDLIFADPDIDVPMVSLQRFPYPEYHTSLDSPAILSAESLEETYQVTRRIVDVLEGDYVPMRKFTGPLYLSRYDLYVDNRENKVLNKKLWHVMQNVGTGKSVLEISHELDMDFFELRDYLDRWEKEGLIARSRVS